MSGNSIGGKKAATTNKTKYGKDFYHRIGRTGGLAQVPKGLALMDREKHIKASVKGGTISRRTK